MAVTGFLKRLGIVVAILAAPLTVGLAAEMFMAVRVAIAIIAAAMGLVVVLMAVLGIIGMVYWVATGRDICKDYRRFPLNWM